MAQELELLDILDSRDLIARLEELEDMEDSERAEFQTEYDELKRVCEEGEQESSYWEYGETLIHHAYFTDYIMDMLVDCGDISENLPWWIVIDREATADNCKDDYTYINIYDTTYYLRNQ